MNHVKQEIISYVEMSGETQNSRIVICCFVFFKVNSLFASGIRILSIFIPCRVME